MHQGASRFDGEVAGPCCTQDPIWLLQGQYKHSLQTIRASVAFLLLDKSILPVLLTEVGHVVHHGPTKIDHYGVGTGIGKTAEAETSILAISLPFIVFGVYSFPVYPFSGSSSLDSSGSSSRL